MSAVATKPRANAKRKAEKSALRTRLDKIFTNLKLGQEKLQLAHHSVGLTDLGDAPEILLRAVIEDMLPPAIAPMYRQPLTRADVDAAYTGMFTSLAAIDGVIALSLGQVIEDTLRDAWALLDEANTLMDFTDMKDALPEAPPGAPSEAPASAEKQADAWLTFDVRDRLLNGLHHSKAALSMLMLVFSNEPRIEEPKRDIAGLMGTLQYARRMLDALNLEVVERGTELDELYWSVFGASSLVALLEEVEWADCFEWRIGEGLVCDYLTAAYDCIESAIDHLERSEVQS